MKWLNDLKEILTDSWGFFRQILVVGVLAFICMSPVIIYSEVKAEEANPNVENVMAFLGGLVFAVSYLLIQSQRKGNKGPKT